MDFSYQLVADSTSPLDGSVVVAPFILKIRNNVITYVPKDPANCDYQEYLEWVAEGNTPDPADSEE